MHQGTEKHKIGRSDQLSLLDYVNPYLNRNVEMLCRGVIIATNRGYDTDCTAASACALCGAISGAKNIRPDLIKTLDEGIANNPYTNAHFTNITTADGLYRAIQSKVCRMQGEIMEMNNDVKIRRN